MSGSGIHRTTAYFCVLALLLLPVGPGTVLADEVGGESVEVPPPASPSPAPAPKTSSGRKWGAHVDIGFKGGNDRYLGGGDFFIPLWQNDRALLFSDLRVMGDNDKSVEGNIGLAYRRMGGG